MARPSRQQAERPRERGGDSPVDNVAEQAAAIAVWVAETLAVAEQLRIKTMPVDTIPLSRHERDLLATLPRPSKKLREKLADDDASLTVAELTGLVKKIGAGLAAMAPDRRTALLAVSRTMADGLYDHIMALAAAEPADAPADGKSTKANRRAGPAVLYQFKLTLLGIEPPIWRRIQTPDCTLDQFHLLIQAAMGWTNSHLHEFQVEGQRYTDPFLLEDGFDDGTSLESPNVQLSEVLPASGKRFRFQYLYDFGDGWEHEVLFEGCPAPEKGKKYPLCLEGERACPPEDIGGIWGYVDFLEAMADPKHPEHKHYREWYGSKFDPEAFNPASMKKRLRFIHSQED